MNNHGGRMKKWPFVFLALLAVTLIWLPQNARASQDQAGGIWWHSTGPQDTSFSIINLTSVDMKITQIPSGDTIFKVNSVVTAYRTLTWKYHVVAGTPTWSGNMTIVPQSGLSSYQIAVQFDKESGYSFIYGDGTWVHLLAGGSYSAYKNSPTQGQWLYGRWATPSGDHTMHNIMTSISDRFTVSLYSHNNKDFILAFSETLSNDNFAGWQLDWVENSGSSLPKGY